MNLSQAVLNQTYFVKKVSTNKEVIKHLLNLGIRKSERITLLSHDKSNAIILVGNSRIAIDTSLLRAIEVSEEALPIKNEIGLNEIAIGDSGFVTSIQATGAVKRRLMDMGITRGTKLYVRKVAPLGDPVEVHLRGYELTLRKEEAELIRVIH